VLAGVTLPRCWGSLLIASCWVAWMAFAETSVVYFLQVPTFAEEIHTQFSGGDRRALAQSVLLSFPAIVVFATLLMVVVPRLERALPSLAGASRQPRSFALRAWRWPWSVVVSLLAAAWFVLPGTGLVWKAGLARSPRTWSLGELGARLQGEGQVALGTIARTVFAASATALVTAALGLTCCWLARESRWFRAFLCLIVAVAWSLPGPIVGIGLLELALRLPIWPLDMLLYHGPSPVPVMWAQFIRFFPVSVALFWPLVRQVPRELVESARLEGAGPLQELTQAVWPQVASGFGLAAAVLTALCLGEVSASARVETPGWPTFAWMILDRMHYGPDGTVSVLCLLLLGLSGQRSGSWSQFGG
jgi:ABC-type Fe3+ transport system permease subunit